MRAAAIRQNWCVNMWHGRWLGSEFYNLLIYFDFKDSVAP
jgi:hypothetical protein